MARRIKHSEADVHPSRKRNQQQAPAEREIKIETPVDEEHRPELAEHAEPAQTYDGLHPEAALVGAEGV